MAAPTSLNVRIKNVLQCFVCVNPMMLLCCMMFLCCCMMLLGLANPGLVAQSILAAPTSLNVCIYSVLRCCVCKSSDVSMLLNGVSMMFLCCCMMFLGLASPGLVAQRLRDFEHDRLPLQRL